MAGMHSRGFVLADRFDVRTMLFGVGGGALIVSGRLWGTAVCTVNLVLPVDVTRRCRS